MGIGELFTARTEVNVCISDFITTVNHMYLITYFPFLDFIIKETPSGKAINCKFQLPKFIKKILR